MKLLPMAFLRTSIPVPLLLIGLMSVGLGLVLSGCSKTEAVVRWPALHEMDEWAEKAEGWIDQNNIAAMQKALPEVQAAAKNLLASAVPANAHEPKAVAQSLADFRDVVKHLDQPKLSDDDLKAQMSALHPLVEKLMEQSGMPHVHEHEEHKK